MKQLFIAFIRGYQVTISPWLGTNCRFQPTCSGYAIEAINRFGVLKGGYLAVKRLLKCHPFHDGGYDPVPSSQTDLTSAHTHSDTSNK